MPTWARTSIAAMTALAFVLTLTFVAVYALRSPWRSTPVGRLLMSDGLVVGTLLGTSVWGIFVGQPWWPLALAGMAALCVLAAWRIRLVLRAQRSS